MINLKEFFEFLAIPSISSEPSYKGEVRRCALFLQNKLHSLGFETELWETKKHPILFGKSKHLEGKPTLLIYNHYDVQPVDPLELWESPPFEPVIKEGEVYARGAQDNKGQCFYVLEALRYLKEQDGAFPLNIKLIIEGEEECGSESLHEIALQKQEALKSDYVAIIDLGMPGKETPALTLGTRGLITFEIHAHGTNKDIHSGSHGGLVYNPIHALVEILAAARDTDGKITIPGFYEGLIPLEKAAKDNIDFTFDEKEYTDIFGAPPTGGEKGCKPLERVWLRPTFEINGISGGYTGDGFKTVIPSQAIAKCSCRLVAGQNPKKMAHLIKEHFEKQAPKGVKIDVKLHGEGGEASFSNPSSKPVLAFKAAYEEVFGKPCRFILEGASIPIIPKLVKASGAEPVFLGLGLVTDQIHSPNEHFGLDRLEKGAKIVAKAIKQLGG